MDNAFDGANEEHEMFLTAIVDHLTEQGEEIDEDQLGGKIEEVITKVLPELGASLVSALKKRSRSMLADRARLARGFQRRQYTKWREPFDLLLMTLEASRELAANFCKFHSQDAADENDAVFGALVRLHARACLVTSEILHLMRGGYASGAMSRWRTLHETAVVAAFIRARGKETAERFLSHAVIESCKAAHQQQEYHQRLGLDPHSEETGRS